jgi:hypothetical protein
MDSIVDGTVKNNDTIKDFNVINKANSVLDNVSMDYIAGIQEINSH